MSICAPTSQEAGSALIGGEVSRSQPMSIAGLPASRRRSGSARQCWPPGESWINRGYQPGTDKVAVAVRCADRSGHRDGARIVTQEAVAKVNDRIEGTGVRIRIGGRRNIRSARRVSVSGDNRAGNINLCGRIVRGGRRLNIEAAACVLCGVAGDGAVFDGDRVVIHRIHAAALIGSVVSGNGAILEDCRTANASHKDTAPLGAGVSRDRAVLNGGRAAAGVPRHDSPTGTASVSGNGVAIDGYCGMVLPN